jgi:PAS domain S-box-containing protein
MTPAPVIFIVEDEAIVANDIRETLISLGYGVAGIARTGESAVEKVAEVRPDLVLMDIHLAGTMDGIEAAGMIHARYGIPVIFLTAYADNALLERAKAAEPYGYIIKPYDERGLHSAIGMAVHKHAAERRLKESEATTRLMVNATQDLLFLIHADGKILVVNEALASRAGVPVDTLIGSSAYDLVGKKILTPKMACWNLKPGGLKRILTEEQLNGGWFETTINPVYDALGNAEKFAVSIRNITARKLAEKQVKNNAEYFRLLIEEASEVVVMITPDGTFSQPSPSFRNMLGYSEHDTPKRLFYDYISPNDAPAAHQVLAEILLHPGMVKPVRLACRKRDGTFCAIKGIMSNQTHNPTVGAIVLSGWVE